ncbi:MAG: putative chemotaxis protein CheW [Pseudomonadota bacterium]
MQSFSQPLDILSFTLGGEGYGIEISTVQELRGYGAITGLANTPSYLKGVINLRGLVVPVIDMRIKFKLGLPVYNGFTKVIILNLGKRLLGIVVDSVLEVMTFAPGQLKPTASSGMAFDSVFLIGMGKLSDRMLPLIDIGKLLADFDLRVPLRISN